MVDDKDIVRHSFFMKTKIVEHIADDIYSLLREVEGEAKRIIVNTPSLQQTGSGAGLDMCVLKEKLADAIKLTNLLTKRNYLKKE